MKTEMICKCCGSKVEQSKFCSNCGALLVDDSNTSTIKPVEKVEESEVNTEPSDKNLKLMMNCCRKVLATALGDGYDEIVLYLDETTNQYQLHTYSKPVGQQENHKGYTVDKKEVDELYKLLENCNPKQYLNQRSFGITGGEVIFKYRDSNDELLRFSSSTNLNEKDVVLYYTMNNAMRGLVDVNNIILPDFVLNWKAFTFSKQKDTSGEFRFEVSRKDDELSVRGFYCINDEKIEVKQYKQLSQSLTEEIYSLRLETLNRKTSIQPLDVPISLYLLSDYKLEMVYGNDSREEKTLDVIIKDKLVELLTKELN